MSCCTYYIFICKVSCFYLLWFCKREYLKIHNFCSSDSIHLMHSPDISNRRIYNLSSGPPITHFSRTKKFQVNVCFEMSEDSVRTAGDNSKLTSKLFSATLLLCSFKLVLYLYTTAISHQIKYYFRGNFLEM